MTMMAGAKWRTQRHGHRCSEKEAAVDQTEHAPTRTLAVVVVVSMGVKDNMTLVPHHASDQHCKRVNRKRAERQARRNTRSTKQKRILKGIRAYEH